MAALGGRFSSRLRSATGCDLGLVVHFSAMLQTVFASPQSFIAFDRRKLKCSRFSENDFESFASTGANTPRPLTRAKYLDRHRLQLGLGRRNSKVEQTAKHWPAYGDSELRYKEDDERMNLNSGEPLRESARFRTAFWVHSVHDRSCEETRGWGREQSSRLPCPSIGMTKCIAGSKRTVHQDRHWL